MLGHTYKEHGDGIHPPAALVFKNIRASYTIRQGGRSNHGRGRGQASDQAGPGRGRGRGAFHGYDLGDMEYDNNTDMDYAGISKKRVA
jgi:hypothetical protein